jgi:hypothetical protein
MHFDLIKLFIHDTNKCSFDFLFFFAAGVNRVGFTNRDQNSIFKSMIY